MHQTCLEFYAFGVVAFLYIQASDGEECPDQHKSTVQYWMMLCQGHPEFQHGDSKAIEIVDWSTAAIKYDELNEIPSFIAQQCQQYVHSSCNLKVDPQKLQGKQLEAYDVVQDHYHSKEHRSPLRMIISGTEGTGNSYLIKCLKNLLVDHLHVTATTGGAHTMCMVIHYILSLAFELVVTLETWKVNVSVYFKNHLLV